MWKSIPLALVGLVLVSPAAQSIDIQVVKINETVDAWLVEDHSNPLVTLKFGFEGGSRWDEPGKEGTASLTFGSLNEGAGDMNAETLAICECSGGLLLRMMRRLPLHVAKTCQRAMR